MRSRDCGQVVFSSDLGLIVRIGRFLRARRSRPQRSDRYRLGAGIGPRHHAALGPHVIDRVLDDVEPRPFLEQPAREDAPPALIELSHVELDERAGIMRSEEHTSELQSLMRISYAVFCLKKKTNYNNDTRVKHYN